MINKEHITLWADELWILNEFWIQKFFSIQILQKNWIKQIDKKISNLKRKWLIKTIKRWLFYIIPLEYRNNKNYIPDSKFFVQFIDGNPIISHWTALAYHDLSEQIFNKMIVTVDKDIKKHNIKLGWIEFCLVKNLSNKNFGTQNVIADNRYVKITDIERTILECLARPDLCMNIKEWLKAYYNAYIENNLNFEKIDEYLEYYKSKSKLMKILWYFWDLFEMKIPKNIYKKWTHKIKQNYVFLETNTENIKWQIYDKKWKLIINNEENFKSLINF